MPAPFAPPVTTTLALQAAAQLPRSAPELAAAAAGGGETRVYVKPVHTGGQCPWTDPQTAELVVAVAANRRGDRISWAAIKRDALAGVYPNLGARLEKLVRKGNKSLQRRWYEFEGKADCKKKNRRFR